MPAPTMAVDLAGPLHVVWPTLVDGAEPAMRFFHASTRDGVTFTRRQAIETLGTPKPSHPQMALDVTVNTFDVQGIEIGASRAFMPNMGTVVFGRPTRGALGLPTRCPPGGRSQKRR